MQLHRNAGVSKPLGVLVVLLAAATLAYADDVTIKPGSAGDNVIVQDAASAARLQVSGGGSVFLPGLAAGPAGAGPLCYDTSTSPSGQVVKCNSAAGLGLPALGFGYHLATVADAVVVGGADVPFSNNGPLANVIHTVGTTTFTVLAAGTYSLSYRVNITVGAGSAVAVAVNGVVAASTNITNLLPVGSNSGTALLTLAAGDVITIRNNSATLFTLDLAPGVGAQLVLLKVQ
jgi:hypothetical protein